MAELQIPDLLSCVLSRDEETGRWLGHCLDFDLVTSGKTEDEAWKNLRGVVKMHIEHCFTHHRAGLTLRADEEEWDLFRASSRTQPARRDKIVLNLIPPPEHEHTFWIQAIELKHDAKTAAPPVPAVH